MCVRASADRADRSRSSNALNVPGGSVWAAPQKNRGDRSPSAFACYSCRPGCRVIEFQSKLKWMIVTSISLERGSDGRGRLHLEEVNLYGWLAYTFKYTSNNLYTHTRAHTHFTLNQFLEENVTWDHMLIIGTVDFKKLLNLSIYWLLQFYATCILLNFNLVNSLLLTGC